GPGGARARGLERLAICEPELGERVAERLPPSIAGQETLALHTNAQADDAQKRLGARRSPPCLKRLDRKAGLAFDERDPLHAGAHRVIWAIRPLANPSS